MSPLFLIVCIVAMVALTAQGIIIKRFDEKRPGAELTYTFVCAVFAFILFVIIALASGSKFNPDSFVYSLLFAICYAGATVTYVLAVGCGSLAITTTIYSFALIIPTLLGFFIWDEPVNTAKIIGIVLFAVSIIFMSEKPTEDEKKVSAKWLILVCIAFFFEGVAPVAIKMHSIALGEEAAAEGNGTFMALAYAVAAVGLFVAALIREGRLKITQTDGKTKSFMLDSIKIALPLAFLGGVCNGVYNFMTTIVSNNKLNVSVFFPVVSAGQLIITCILAVVMFKEKLTKRQLLAIGFGTIAIVLLNV
ncbi:MAG: EamA family transporter [Clostridia bacterium]|nr:EamA family transporter [Clostridia bacterium]